ncbi:MAG: ferrochelatase [Magnetococcales bacterium]|nr:ferrochelatase [Magnetococcales bacterium]MBF0150633.1 ferrochelatase [Magnetococcales bacterium]MBF0173544.1 ferrochelatase [Magnetococcales bacterium]MBF0347966.1 ferrochelatase [Magnetococcales bacterium]MBF0630450.1 ferrochelatase [Magnetococcales bacterium]
MYHTGVLLLQLGTPASPDPTAVRRYLGEFLSDPMVVDLPRLIWLPILHGIILRTRPKKSARLYQKIWMENGRSPLLHHSLSLVQELERRLDPGILLRLAMRYGQPGIEETLNEMHRQGVARILVLPLFPQYSGSTTGSAVVRVFELLRQLNPIPTVRIAQPFYQHPGYIQALAERIHRHHPPHPERHYLFSFHGLPQRHVRRGDPYQRHCTTTATLLAQTLPLEPHQWTLTFQSRFGPEAWLTPNTADLLATLPAQGKTDIAVICPGFVADCLETLEEISVAGRNTFIHHGGRTFGFVPCLNDAPSWLTALTSIIHTELAGWHQGEGKGDRS